MRGKVDEVLIAMPSASKLTLRSLLKEIENYSVKVRILPGLAELAEGKVLVSELKEVDISDLLGRKEAEANQDLINKNIAQKVVLITGAGGSIGSEISRQVVRKASKVILLDTNEYALYSIKNEIENLLPEIELHAVLGSVTNKKKITEICKTFAVDTVYHAAAYKHVPLVEENPFEAGLGFAVRLKKEEDFIGKQALLQILNKPLKKQMEQSIDSKFAVIVAPKEFSNRMIVLRNMAERSEKQISVENLLSELG